MKVLLLFIAVIFASPTFAVVSGEKAGTGNSLCVQRCLTQQGVVVSGRDPLEFCRSVCNETISR